MDRTTRLLAHCVILCLIGLTCSSVSLASESSDAIERFEAKVRPILVTHCHRCHGEEKQEAGLRLDSRSAIIDGGDRGTAVIPGEPEKSLLILAVQHEHEEVQMPPEEQLSGHLVAELVRWVAEGATWPQERTETVSPTNRIEELRRTHWAYRPIQLPRLPVIGEKARSANPIDHFVIAGLTTKRLSLSSRADRHTLIRRAYFDLIGLPPTYEQLRAFVDDRGDDAFYRLLDGLLARREYGERWGRHWLDVARYSDTKGYVDAGEPEYPFAYTYRDYVIRAFNEDLPYDQFVLQQLAADRMVQNDDRSPLAALGFLTVGKRFNFFPHEIIDDRIDVVTRGFMGLTVTCARCHDHKYDPIPTADYYALYGVMASSMELLPDELPILAKSRTSLANQQELEKNLRDKAEKLKKRIRQLHQQIMHEMRAWASDYLVYLVQTMPEHRTQAQPPIRTERGRLREISAYGRGAVFRWRRYIRACGPDHPVFGFWNRAVRIDRRNFAAGAQEVLADLIARSQINPLVGQALSQNPPQLMVDVAKTYGALLEETERLYRDAGDGAAGDVSPEKLAREELHQVLYGEGSPATVTLDEAEDAYHLGEHEEVRGLFAEVERALLAMGSMPSRAMVLVDRPEPIQSYIFVRGNPDRRGKAVSRRVPKLLSHIQSEPFTRGSGRLELARCIVDPKNPLTARVISNRIWAWHFGRALVATPSDFGLRSSAPTHPELLDYLASQLTKDEWSIKKLHRRIMGSSTWQQASIDRTDCRQVDPANQLLWRMNRRRRDLESLRDSMLAVAERLAQRGEGPPTKQALDDPANMHRTVFCHVDRNRPAGLRSVFDFPSPDISSPQRPNTTVPQQALFFLNSPFVIAQADAIARHLEESYAPDDLTGRMKHLYNRVYQREPDRDEFLLGTRFLNQQTLVNSRDGKAGRPRATTPWVEYVQTLLQSNEFQFVD